MNNQPPNPEDEKLRTLLRESHGGSELPPRFQEAVWSRIERGEIEPAAQASLLERFLSGVLRPQWVALTLALFLAAGVVSGLQQGRDRAMANARARYLATVNPFEKR